MMGLKQPTAREYAIVCQGPAGDVRLSPSANEAYLQAIDGKDEISVKRKTHLGRYFGVFCEQVHFHRQLSDEKLKKEGNFPDGKGGSVAVWAFKSWQWRLYGAIMPVAGRRCFVGVEIDSAKKRNRADQNMLRNAAKAIASLAEYGCWNVRETRPWRASVQLLIRR